MTEHETKLVIEPGQFYRTRDGNKVSILEYDASSLLPWIGAVRQTDGRGWTIREWTEYGGYSRSPLLSSNCDLVAVWTEPTMTGVSITRDWLEEKYDNAMKIMYDSFIYGQSALNTKWDTTSRSVYSDNEKPFQIIANPMIPNNTYYFIPNDKSVEILHGQVDNLEAKPKQYNVSELSELIKKVGIFEPQVKAKCECGASKCGHLKHSSWCPLHTED